MDRTAVLDAPHPPAAVYAWVDDLARYVEWLDIVQRARPAAPAEGDAGPAWHVDLRGRIGPFARSKRLRMVRTEHVPDRTVRFERRELDRRQHSPWVLTAHVHERDGGSRLEVHLHYGGGLFGPLLDRILGDEIEASRSRLLACLDRT